MGVAASLHADRPPDAISVDGCVSKPDDWTVARLKSELSADIGTVSYTTKDQKHTSSAVPLVALLKASGVSTQLKADPTADPKTKHHELRLVVVVQGVDGYVATFSLAELLGELGNRPAWLAFEMDEKPLSATEGPLKLIVPDDQKPARWVHAVRSISVVDITPTTQPV
jgi:DMSO/TMAO reductase YedYZ molybdopterin-dependent catalytic subunit